MAADAPDKIAASIHGGTWNLMDKEKLENSPQATEGEKEWQEPKLTFVEPKLTKQGDFVEITGQFFGAFSP
jgi:hypothetical protein